MQVVPTKCRFLYVRNDMKEMGDGDKKTWYVDPSSMDETMN